MPLSHEDRATMQKTCQKIFNTFVENEYGEYLHNKNERLNRLKNIAQDNNQVVEQAFIETTILIAKSRKVSFISSEFTNSHHLLDAFYECVHALRSAGKHELAKTTINSCIDKNLIPNPNAFQVRNIHPIGKGDISLGSPY